MNTPAHQKMTDRPVVLLLGAVVTAFVAGISAWIFLTSKVEEQTRAVVVEMKNSGDLQVTAKDSEATTQLKQGLEKKLEALSSDISQLVLRVEVLETGKTERQAVVVPPTVIPVHEAQWFLSNQLIVKPLEAWESLKTGKIELTIGSDSPEIFAFDGVPRRKALSVAGQEYFIDVLDCDYEKVTISVVQKL